MVSRWSFGLSGRGKGKCYGECHVDGIVVRVQSDGEWPSTISIPATRARSSISGRPPCRGKCMGSVGAIVSKSKNGM